MSNPQNIPPFKFHQGSTPLLLSVPHAGLELLPGMVELVTQDARKLPDTDWYVDQLYKWVTAEGAGLLVANYSRYVVDLNRPADDSALYTEQVTGLFPQQTFAAQALWVKQANCAYSRDWIMANIWQPYHQKIATELARLKQKFGYAILLDAHSIAPFVPSLFTGKLADLNLGSFAGASADAGLVQAVWQSLDSTSYSRVLDGRFKGGAITRGFGRPENNIHALQLELSQATYLNDQTMPPRIDSAKVLQLMPILTRMIAAMLSWNKQTHA